MHWRQAKRLCAGTAGELADIVPARRHIVRLADAMTTPEVQCTSDATPTAEPPGSDQMTPAGGSARAKPAVSQAPKTERHGVG